MMYWGKSGSVPDAPIETRQDKRNASYAIKRPRLDLLMTMRILALMLEAVEEYYNSCDSRCYGQTTRNPQWSQPPKRNRATASLFGGYMFLIWLCLVNARLAISLAAAFFPRRKKTGSQKFNIDDAQRQRQKAIFGKGNDVKTLYKEKERPWRLFIWEWEWGRGAARSSQYKRALRGEIRIRIFLLLEIK